MRLTLLKLLERIQRRVDLPEPVHEFGAFLKLRDATHTEGPGPR